MNKRLRPNPSRLAMALDRLKAGDSWRADGRTTAARGYGSRWQRERLEYLDANPLCVMCKARGLITAGCVVDHIEPHGGDDGLMWNRDNWQTLCTPCHNSAKQAAEWKAKYGR